MSLSDALAKEKEGHLSWLEDAFWLASAAKNNKSAPELNAAFPATLSAAADCKRIFLKNESKNIPLPEFPAGEIMRGRTVFYPGAGTDGQPLKLFCGSHSAHCFIYADYAVKKGEILKQLGENLAGLHKGYKTLFAIEGGVKDFFPDGWEDLRETYSDIDMFHPPELQWGFWAVLERGPEYDSAFGPKRILFCYLCCDAISAFSSFWPKGKGKRRTSPYAVVVEDSGFGSNWAVFGSEKSQLYKIAARNHALPDWLLVGVGRNAQAWPGYNRFSEETEPGGYDGSARALFEKQHRLK
jgi:hypothetical protein